MNRRDFVRAMIGATAAAPFAGYAMEGSAAGMPFQGPPPGILQVYLEGPFAVVLKKDTSSKIIQITAYAPLEKIRAHKFHYHGDRDNSLNYNLTLKNTGLVLSSNTPTVNSAFDSFKGTATSGPKINSFIKVELPPSPEQIVSFSSIGATFVDNTTATMPLDHVLLYKVSDINQVTLSCDRFPDAAPDKTGINSGQFHLQVGLPKGSDAEGHHAVEFFNERLLGAFPNSGVKKLKSIDKVVAAIDVECKNGGLLLFQS